MFPLLGIPGFPFQAACGFVLGFTLARRLRARSVVFVWVLPLLWFGLGALVVAPTSELDYLIGGSLQRKSRVLLPTLVHIAVDRFHCVHNRGSRLQMVPGQI